MIGITSCLFIVTCRSLTIQRHYGEVAQLLQAVLNVLDHFEGYMHLSQVKQLADKYVIMFYLRVLISILISHIIYIIVSHLISILIFQLYSIIYCWYHLLLLLVILLFILSFPFVLLGSREKADPRRGRGIGRNRGTLLESPSCLFVPLFFILSSKISLSPLFSLLYFLLLLLWVFLD